MPDRPTCPHLLGVVTDGPLEEVEAEVVVSDADLVEQVLAAASDEDFQTLSRRRVALLATTLAPGFRCRWAGRILRSGPQLHDSSLVGTLAAASKNDAATISLILSGRLPLAGVATFARLLAERGEHERLRQLAGPLTAGAGRRLPPAGLLLLAGVAGVGVFLREADQASVVLEGHADGVEAGVLEVASRAAALWEQDPDLFDLASMACPFDGTFDALLEVAETLR